MRHNYIKEQLQANSVRIANVISDDQDAEIFIKTLGRMKFSNNKQQTGVEKIDVIDVDLIDTGETE